jgi:AraC-like DNA-binding protein
MRHFLVVGILLSTQLVLGQSQTLDSLYTVLENHPQHDTLRVWTLLRICHHEFMAHPEKNKMLAEEALKISNEIDFMKGSSGGNRYISFYYWATGEYGEAMKYAYTMLRIVEGTSYLTGIGQAYQLIGVIHSEDQNYGEARKFYEMALTFYQKSNVKKDVGYCYNALGALCINIEKFNEAEAYFLKSIKIREEINDEDGLGQAYGNLALVYIKKKDYATAERHYKISKVIAEKYDNRYRLATVFVNLGELYMLTGKYSLTESHLLKAVEIASSMRQKALLKYAYYNLAQLEKKRGKMENAVKYMELVESYKDSLYIDKTKQVAKVQARYETEKKDQAIQLLERDKRIQQLWTTIFVAAFILLAIVFIVVYFLQRYREQKNRRIFNLEIDKLTMQHSELSEKYKEALTVGTEKNVESHDQLLLKKAIEIVENNISDTLFGVEQMADKIGMSRTSLHRKLKAITGFPPSELIRNIRLRKAASLLRSQSNSVTQISIAVGFEDQSYFSKSFKKQFGVPPSEYLQSTKLVEGLALS